VTATDDVGRVTSMRRAFVVDDTLGFLRAPRAHAVRDGGRPLTVSFELSRPARVQLEALDPSGRLVRRTVVRRLAAGLQRLTWDGRGPGRRALPSGRYTVRVVALGPVGRSQLETPVVLRVAAVDAE
jgi:flagellar hook assembly protein FlgD